MTPEQVIAQAIAKSKKLYTARGVPEVHEKLTKQPGMRNDLSDFHVSTELMHPQLSPITVINPSNLDTQENYVTVVGTRFLNSFTNPNHGSYYALRALGISRSNETVIGIDTPDQSLSELKREEYARAIATQNSIPYFASNINTWLNELIASHPKKKIQLIGHSYSGVVMAQVVINSTPELQDSIKQVILIDPPGWEKALPFSLMQRFFSEKIEMEILQVLPELHPGVYKNIAALSAIEKLRGYSRIPGNIMKNWGTICEFAQGPMKSFIEKYCKNFVSTGSAVPIHIAVGQYSEIARQQEVESVIKGLRAVYTQEQLHDLPLSIKTIPGQGHAMLENPYTFAKYVDEVLNTVPK